MAAPGVLTPPAHSMAIALQGPSVPQRASAMATKTSKKQDLLAVGRRRLERFQKNKRDQASTASKQTFGGLPQPDEQSVSGDATDSIVSSQLPQSEVSVSVPETNGDPPLKPLPITSRHDDLIPKPDGSVSFRPPVRQQPTITDGSASVERKIFSPEQNKHDEAPLIPKPDGFRPPVRQIKDGSASVERKNFSPDQNKHDEAPLIPKPDGSVSFRPPVRQQPTITDGSPSVQRIFFSPERNKHDEAPLTLKPGGSVSFRPPLRQHPTIGDGSASVDRNYFSLEQKKHDEAPTIPKQTSESLPHPSASEQVDSGDLVGTAFEAPSRSFSTSVTNGDGPVKLLMPQPTNYRTISQEDTGSRESFLPFEADRLPTTSSRRDDFAALEQHIEDLTQEKFSLQRGLDKAKALVESLTQANSALTEDYNQQGAKVNELKDELTRCREEIRSQEIVLKSIIAERDRALQESKTAKERSRSLAAENIGLEEKMRKTKSQELKLQKEVESLREELETCRRQVSSIEKDRLNSISMNEALQEEKKVLLTRIREAANLASPPKEDASTSTDDLVVENEPRQSDSAEQLTASPSGLEAYPTSLPPDQLGIIENINALVTELGQERDALLRTLRNESNALTQLKIENAELSQKLERQTQQLELAVAQNMARTGTSISPTISQNVEEVEYIDEGDEVVDRVLGWIMRLFPGGGSSKRGGSKQL